MKPEPQDNSGFETTVVLRLSFHLTRIENSGQPAQPCSLAWMRWLISAIKGYAGKAYRKHCPGVN